MLTIYTTEVKHTHGIKIVVRSSLSDFVERNKDGRKRKTSKEYFSIPYNIAIDEEANAIAALTAFTVLKGIEKTLYVFIKLRGGHYQFTQVGKHNTVVEGFMRQPVKVL